MRTLSATSLHVVQGVVYSAAQWEDRLLPAGDRGPSAAAGLYAPYCGHSCAAPPLPVPSDQKVFEQGRMEVTAEAPDLQAFGREQEVFRCPTPSRASCYCALSDCGRVQVAALTAVLW